MLSIHLRVRREGACWAYYSRSPMRGREACWAYHSPSSHGERACWAYYYLFSHGGERWEEGGYLYIPLG